MSLALLALPQPRCLHYGGVWIQKEEEENTDKVSGLVVFMKLHVLKLYVLFAFSIPH